MATLVYSDVDGNERSLSLGLEPITVGRAQECAIRSQDPRVSRIHASFFVEDGSLWVEDLGSANGVYIGANRVQRAPVPTGEYVLVGSLLIRLLSATGTLPPPNGIHGTLAVWLESERKARAAVEAERDAFGKRVNEIYGETIQLREAVSARTAEAAQLRDELERLRYEGIQAATSPQPTAMTVQASVATVDQSAPTSTGEPTPPELASPEPLSKQQLIAMKARAERAEREVITAQIRAQGAERNLTGVQGVATKAELRVADIERRLGEADARRAQLETELAAQREKTSALETRLGSESVDAALQATEARAAKLAVELAEMTSQFEANRSRADELAERCAEAETTAKAADAREKTAQAQLSEALHQVQILTASNVRQLKVAETRVGEIEARLRTFEGAEAELAAAHQVRENARQTVADVERLMAAATARADASESRANAADVMAKAMAKDVAEALRRAADVDMKGRTTVRELEAALRRIDETEQREAAGAADLRSLEQRAAAAEAKSAELAKHVAEARQELAIQRQVSSASAGQIAALERQIADFGSNRAAEQTGSQSSEDESARRIAELEDQLAAAKAAAKSAVKTAAGLEKRVDASEAEFKASDEARAALAAELAEVRDKLANAQADAERSAAGAEAERRASDEADRAEIEKRAKDEASRAEALDAELRTAYARSRELEAQVAATERRSTEALTRANSIETRAKEVAERIVDAERRAREAQDQLAELNARLHAGEVRFAGDDEGGNEQATLALAQAQARIAELTREVDAAENVRKFAATTEREIAQLERELREQKAAVTQLTLERDRLAAQLGDLHSDSETTNNASSAELSNQADLSRYTALVARAAELETKLERLESDNAALKRDLAEAHASLAALQRSRDDEPTNVATALSIELADCMNVLEESIESLRANMRAASDETAVMEQSESVATVGAAVGQAAEHVERARAALRTLHKLVSPP